MSEYEDFDHKDLQKRFDALAEIVTELVELMPIINVDCGNPAEPAPTKQLAVIREKQQFLLNSIEKKLNTVRHGITLFE